MANGLGTGSSDHYYSFNLPVDCAVQFDSCLSTFNTFLRIYSLDMINELHSCDDCGDCGTRTVLDAELRAGDYILIIEGYSSDEGEYSVTMNCPDSGDYIDGEIACGDTVQGSTVAAGWSAGRVQSPAVKLIVEKDRSQIQILNMSTRF